MGAQVGGWLVLPDRVDARGVAGPVPGSRSVLAHASGPPWLVGTLDRGELTVVSVGSLRVAVIGSCPITATRLEGLVHPVRSVAGLDAVSTEPEQRQALVEERLMLARRSAAHHRRAAPAR